jgi:spore coat polysaccharide biosynthesis protein SpsF
MTIAAIVDLEVDVLSPELVTADLGGRPALAWTLARAKALPSVSDVILSLPAEAATPCVIAIGVCAGVAVHVCEPCDPLARLARAVEIADADTIVHIGANQPLVDADIVTRVLALHAESGADFTCTDMPALWPVGLDVAVFAAELAFVADRCAELPYERAFPTRWMRSDRGVTRACLLGPGCGFEDMRFGLHRQGDLVALRALVAELGDAAATATAARYAGLLMRRADLFDLVKATPADPLRTLVRETAELLSPPQALLAA